MNHQAMPLEIPKTSGRKLGM